MEVVLLKQAREDRDYWLKTGNKRIMKRITDLLNDIQLHPFSGMGKPEPLKGENGK
jgi:toxin YoeB